MRFTITRLVLWLGLCFNITHAFSTDYFFQICHKVIIGNNAMSSCKAESPYSDACFCSNEDYLLSVYACLDEAATLAQAPHSLKQSWNALEVMCRNATSSEFTVTSTVIGAIVAAHPINQTYDAANRTGSGAFTCPESILNGPVIEAGISYHKNLYAANAYGLATCCYILGIIFIQIILNGLSWVGPSVVLTVGNSYFARLFRTYVALPATFGFKRATAFRVMGCWDLCFPPRLHVLFLVGYVVLCATLLSIDYDFVVTQYLNTTHVEAVTKFVGYRSGYFAVYKLPLLILFAGQNNILIWLTGWQYDVFNHWHRWIGRLFLCDLIIHGTCYTMWGQWAGVLLQKWQSFPPWIAAQTATICTGFICILACKSVRAAAYEVFVVVHIILAVIVLIGTWIHISYFGLALEPFYAAGAFWIFDKVARVARILNSGMLSSYAILKPRGDVLQVNVKYSGRWKPVAGSYVFIHFLGLGHFYQSHPFTIVPGPVAGEFRLYTKARDGLTRKMLNYAQHAGGKTKYPVLLDGPYGVDLNSKPFKEIVLIAGGVGFTGIYSQLVAMMEKQGDEKQTVHVHWLLRDNDLLDAFREELLHIESYEMVNFQVHLTRCTPDQVLESWISNDLSLEKKRKSLYEQDAGSITSSTYTVSWGRPDLVETIEDHIKQTRGPMCFYVCGPAVMSDTVRKSVAEGLHLTPHYVQFHEECFTM